MLRIRLRRVGKKRRPSYRIVVAEARSPRDGAYLEWIGNYDPMADPPAMSLKVDRAVQWLSQGAQPSDAVRRILDKNGISKNGSVVEVVPVPPAAEAPPAEESDAPTAQVEVDDATEAVEQAADEIASDHEASAEGSPPDESSPGESSDGGSSEEVPTA